MKIIFWGLGEAYENCRQFVDEDVVGYIDIGKVGQIMPDGKTVLSPEEGLKLEYDRIVISSPDYGEEIWEELKDKVDDPYDDIMEIGEFMTLDSFFSIYEKQIKRSRSKQNPSDMAQARNIYAVVKAGAESGGPELLHQLVYLLNKNGHNAKIAYTKTIGGDIKNATPLKYVKYVEDNILRFEEIPDREDSCVIIPETSGDLLDYFHNAIICFWWLSVDNFWKKVSESILENVYNRVDYHFYQSEYARLFLKRLGIHEPQTRPLYDYINEEYIERSKTLDIHKKENIIAYNPYKGWKYTKKLIASYNEDVFVPIKNMTNSEIQDLLERAKVYIDFGNHPGKDRIPREAALMDCIVVTGKRGAANNAKDIPILGDYKMEQGIDNTGLIVEMIRECLDDYESRIKDFALYKKEIMEEKRRFEEQVRTEF